MKGRVISEIPVLTANPFTGVELAVYYVKKRPESWRRGVYAIDSYEVRWRPIDGDKWNVRSSHKNVGPAVKELARLRDASHGLTFKKRQK